MAHNPVPPATLSCSPLPAFEADNLRAAREAFEPAAIRSLRQGWLAEEEVDFAPALVRAGWRDAALWILADLTDRDISTSATDHNQRFWELGDVFEVFLRDDSAEAYVELQVTPNNHRLQLRYANRAALDRARATGDMSEALMPAGAFRSTTWIEPGRWTVLAEVPASLVSRTSQPLERQRWRCSFSRYDYTRGRHEPVISSSSPHAEADFHRQEDWGFLIFEAR